jgi:transposase-like protein
MSKRQYTTEFKREVVEMAAKGEKSIAELERDLSITPGQVSVRGVASSVGCATASILTRAA